MSVPLDKFLQQSASPVISMDRLQEAVNSALQQVLLPREQALQEFANQVNARLAQLEQNMQPKLSPFEIALRAIPHCSRQVESSSEEPDAESRCYDKAYEIIERFLDASLSALSSTPGQPGAEDREAQGEASGASGQGEGDRSAVLGDQEGQASAEND